jgi:HEAT repeat protein
MEGTTPEGVKVTTWMPPDESVESQIKCLGPVAVPAISALLRSDRSFGVLLAVRMLGWIGGPEIVLSLKGLLETSTSQIAKVNALEALSTAPVEQALPIVQHVLESDSNRYVREKATRIEARLKAKIEDGNQVIE